MRLKNVWIKVLILTNIILLLFLSIVSLHYKVPQKVLNKLGMINFKIQPQLQPRDYLSYKLAVLHSIYKNKLSYEIIMLGDSITAYGNWEQLLKGYNVANYGIPGDTTDGILCRLDELYMANPKKICIMAGTNDIYLIKLSLNDEYSIMTVFDNYQRIVNSLRKNGIEVIIQSTLNVMNENTGRPNAEIDRLNNLLKNFCLENDIKYLDINSVLTKNGFLQEQYTPDGLHLNKKGYEKWKLLLIQELQNS
jgi:lysophospholipase L1-like esterase